MLVRVPEIALNFGKHCAHRGE